MDSASLRLVFLALLMVFVWARVEPPANVTLHCQSMNNVLKWEYDRNTTGLKFRVDIGAYYSTDAEGFRNVCWVAPPALEANLSFLSDPSEVYLLTVTAVVGDQESDPAPLEDGITFSYYQDADVDQKCFVDLPSVNVTVQPHDRVLLRFQHPWLTLYHNQEAKARRKRSHDAPQSDELPLFNYKVTIVNQEDHHTEQCEEEVCEKLLPVDPQQHEYCVEINGDLEHMLVKGSQAFCAQPVQAAAAHDLTYVYVGTSFLAAVLVVLALVLYMIYSKKTKPSRQALRPSPLNVEHQRQQTCDPVQERITVMEVESPTPLLTSTDPQDFTDVTFPTTNSADYTLRMRLGLPSEDDGESDAVEEESAYMRGGSLDEDDFSSSYERRVPVQLGPDDQAEGYRG